MDKRLTDDFKAKFPLFKELCGYVSEEDALFIFSMGHYDGTLAHIDKQIAKMDDANATLEGNEEAIVRHTVGWTDDRKEEGK